MVFTNNTLFAAIDDFASVYPVYKSTDNGMTWNAITSGLAYGTVLFIKIIKNEIYVGFDGAGIYKSVDEGSSWTAINTGLHTGYEAGSMDTSGSTLFVSSPFTGLYMSLNDGASWVSGTAGMQFPFSYSLAVHGDKLFAGFAWDKSIWSRPIADFYSKIDSFSPTSGTSATSVIITGNNFDINPQSNDVQFNGVSATVTAATSTTLTVLVPANAVSGKISVTANGQTSFSTTDFSVDKVVTGLTPLENGNEGITLYPNPSLNTITLSFKTNEKSKITIEIYSLMGQLINQYSKNDNTNLAVDISSFNTGTYIVKVSMNNTLYHTKFAKL